MSNDYLVDTDWLAARLQDTKLRIVDLRGHLLWEKRNEGPPWKSARDDYERSHIPGAIYLDFSTDLVDYDAAVPLQVAPFEKLREVFEKNGIGDEHLVIAYDADRSVFAARLWWIFRLCGHTNIRILDGGWPKWTSEDRPVSVKTPVYPESSFTIDPDTKLRATVDDVFQSVGTGTHLLLDARVRKDYLGNPKWAERGGHIPGALNVPGGELLNSDGTFRSISELRHLVNTSVQSSELPMITYCGLGLSATALAFALEMLGFQNVSVFDGGWAEWGARDDLPSVSAGDGT